MRRYQETSQRKTDDPVRQQRQEKRRCRCPMGPQQDKTGKQQQAQNGKLRIGPALQNPAIPAEMVDHGHQQEKQASEDQHSTAAQDAPLAPASVPFRVLSPSIETAVQSYHPIPRNNSRRSSMSRMLNERRKTLVTYFLRP
jgi:hypothetical protein